MVKFLTKFLKWSALSAIFVSGIYYAVFHGESWLMISALLLSPLLVFCVAAYHVIQWAKGLDHYSVQLKVTSNRPLPTKIAGVPENLTFQEYLTALNLKHNPRTTREVSHVDLSKFANE